TAFGEKIVARIFDPDVVLQDIGELGFFEDQGRAWHNFASRPHGMVLLTGPTGSGKTTTLYSTLKVLAGPEVNITTVEDPIEMVTDAFNQIAVNPRKDVTFASALRAVLRQDPDIVMVGEIRDLETARLAVQAALTGRLIDLGIEPFLVASTVVGVAAQRLVRRVCDRCAVETHLGEAQVRLLGIEVPPDGDPLPVRDGEGCVECRGTGYRGRSGVYEVLPVSASVRHAVRTTADTDHIKAIARREGMLTLHEAAVRKLALGVTTFDEVIRVTRQDD
ncbi:MAG: GspE/PulE family protein, partial [Planctomycetota bacterium]